MKVKVKYLKSLNPAMYNLSWFEMWEDLETGAFRPIERSKMVFTKTLVDTMLFCNGQDIEFHDGKNKLIITECMRKGCKGYYIGPEPQICCSGNDCGCMGLPMDPVLCNRHMKEIFSES